MLKLDRREFLAGAGAGFLSALGGPAAAALDDADMLFASACRFEEGDYGAVIFSERGEIIRQVRLPDRGHDVVFDRAGRRAVAFARRPGNFALCFSADSRETPVAFASKAGRHFYGHGAFSGDGRLLYATENDFSQARGVIGIYDATGGFNRVGEFDSHGVGPHELLMMPDGHTLAICNGGIETHPDYGRAKLNIDRMKPSLVFIDSRDGRLIESHELPTDLHQLSIRHMQVRPDGCIFFGGQYEGPEIDMPPLIGRAVMGERFELFDIADDDRRPFRNYIGSVAVSRDGSRFAVSSPRGNIVAVLDAASGRILERWPLHDGCGLAADRNGFMATSGDGMAGTLGDMAQEKVFFDNHIARADNA
ncbi:MAG: DUF1513 domain-containing protein [Rhodobiaceae bacterium]|nr:DUF1513 domain-containing protein [Rhodobiaceae bacterium]MCC0055617.1 DUF1513 domain-containing protein [Rhodobiaceae bacterium]